MTIIAPVCAHGNAASRHPSRKPAHEWTLLYWPIALAGAVLAFYIPYLLNMGMVATGIGLAVGTGLLGLPELGAIATGNAQDTFSDWVWNTAHITGTRPMNQWNAEHFLLLGAYLAIAGGVAHFLFLLATIHWQLWFLFAADVYFAGCWLPFHFFFRWWT